MEKTAENIIPSPNEKAISKQISEIAFFGKGLSVIVCVFFALSLYKGHQRWWLLCLSIVLMAVSFTYPTLLKPVYKLAMKFGTIMHHIISPLLMAITFYVVFMPVGMLFRLTRKDLLKLRMNKANSYWIMRDPPGPENNSLKNQF